MQCNSFPSPQLNTRLYLLFILAIWCLVSACTPSHLTEDELKAYVLAQQSLTKTKESKGFVTQVSYRPVDLLIAQELGRHEAANPSELEHLKKKYIGYHYFILSLSSGDKEALYQAGSGYRRFSDLVQTLSFRMDKYVDMTTSGSDTIQVADYVFSPTYGMGGATSLMLVFNKKYTRDDEWIQFNLDEFGLGIGSQTFRFWRKDLEEIPRIKFAVQFSKKQENNNH